MRLHLTLFTVCVTLLSACGTSYKVAPTSQSDKHVAKVAEHVSKATLTAKANRERAKALDKSLKAGETATIGVITAIDAAIRSLELKDYPAVGQHLIAAKMGAGFLLTENIRLQGEVVRLVEENDSILMDLGAAYDQTAIALKESEKFQKEVNKLATSQAKAQAIVDQVNWGFGLGAFIYGIKRILTFGFFGVLALIVVFIVLICIGGPFAAFAWRSVAKILSWLRSRKSVT